jgi:nitroreductase
MSAPVFDTIIARKHIGALALALPAPDAVQQERLIEAALAAPDHGKLAPFRFIAIPAARRAEFAVAVEAALVAANPQADEIGRKKAREKTLAAPWLVAVIARFQPDHPKILIGDQWLAVGAAMQNMWLAAEEMGFSCGVTSGALLDEAALRGALGLSAAERCVSLVAVGTAKERQPARPKPAVTELFSQL